MCENCPDQPWSEEIGCVCGAGMLCKCQRKNRDVMEGVEEPDVSQLLDKKPLVKN